MFRLAHISDPHLPPPAGALSGRDLLSKRALSNLAWQRKGKQHDPAVLAALTADVADYAPDHLAITGDLTNFSTLAEYAAARAWLNTLGPPSAVTVSPGNHDALVARGQVERLATLQPWLGDNLETTFPHVRTRGGVTLINLCSAAPSPPAFATGRLGEPQLERLAKVLKTLGAANRIRVVLLHHPPSAGVVSPRKALVDAPALREILHRHGAELVLHGHGHEAAFSMTPGHEGPIAMLGVPSASAAPGHKHPAARWHAIEIDPVGGAITVIARGLVPGSGRFKEIGRYSLPRLRAAAAA